MTTNRPRNIRHLHYIKIQLDPPRGNRIGPSVAGDLEIVLWNEAWSGAKDQDEEGWLPALSCVKRKAVSQGFGGFCVVIGFLSRHITFYDSHLGLSPPYSRDTQVNRKLGP